MIYRDLLLLTEELLKPWTNRIVFISVFERSCFRKLSFCQGMLIFYDFLVVKLQNNPPLCNFRIIIFKYNNNIYNKYIYNNILNFVIRNHFDIIRLSSLKSGNYSSARLFCKKIQLLKWQNDRRSCIGKK